MEARGLITRDMRSKSDGFENDQFRSSDDCMASGQSSCRRFQAESSNSSNGCRRAHHRHISCQRVLYLIGCCLAILTIFVSLPHACGDNSVPKEVHSRIRCSMGKPLMACLRTARVGMIGTCGAVMPLRGGRWTYDGDGDMPSAQSMQTHHNEDKQPSGLAALGREEGQGDETLADPFPVPRLLRKLAEPRGARDVPESRQQNEKQGYRIGRAAAALARIQADMANTGSDMANIGSEMTNTGSDMANTGSDMAITGSDLANTGSNVANTGSKVANTGGTTERPKEEEKIHKYPKVDWVYRPGSAKDWDFKLDPNAPCYNVDDMPVIRPEMPNAMQWAVDQPEEQASPEDRLLAASTVFVTALHFKAREEDVAQLMRQAGQVTSVRVPLREDGRKSGTAYVVYKTPEEAKEALALDGTELRGRKIHVSAFDGPIELLGGKSKIQQKYGGQYGGINGGQRDRNDQQQADPMVTKRRRGGRADRPGKVRWRDAMARRAKEESERSRPHESLGGAPQQAEGLRLRGGGHEQAVATFLLQVGVLRLRGGGRGEEEGRGSSRERNKGRESDRKKDKEGVSKGRHAERGESKRHSVRGKGDSRSTRDTSRDRGERARSSGRGGRERVRRDSEGERARGRGRERGSEKHRGRERERERESGGEKKSHRHGSDKDDRQMKSHKSTRGADSKGSDSRKSRKDQDVQDQDVDQDVQDMEDVGGGRGKVKRGVRRHVVQGESDGEAMEIESSVGDRRDVRRESGTHRGSERKGSSKGRAHERDDGDDENEDDERHQAHGDMMLSDESNVGYDSDRHTRGKGRHESRDKETGEEDEDMLRDDELVVGSEAERKWDEVLQDKFGEEGGVGGGEEVRQDGEAKGGEESEDTIVLPSDMDSEEMARRVREMTGGLTAVSSSVKERDKDIRAKRLALALDQRLMVTARKLKAKGINVDPDRYKILMSDHRDQNFDLDRSPSPTAWRVDGDKRYPVYPGHEEHDPYAAADAIQDVIDGNGTLWHVVNNGGEWEILGEEDMVRADFRQRDLTQKLWPPEAEHDKRPRGKRWVDRAFYPETALKDSSEEDEDIFDDDNEQDDDS